MIKKILMVLILMVLIWMVLCACVGITLNVVAYPFPLGSFVAFILTFFGVRYILTGVS